MSKLEKLLLKLLSGNSDANFSFDEIQKILLHLGFEERRTGGSHIIYTKRNIEEIINIQPKGAQAKPYQVKQVRGIVLKYKLNSYGS